MRRSMVAQTSACGLESLVSQTKVCATIQNVESNQVGLREQVFGLSRSRDKFRHQHTYSEKIKWATFKHDDELRISCCLFPI